MKKIILSMMMLTALSPISSFAAKEPSGYYCHPLISGKDYTLYFRPGSFNLDFWDDGFRPGEIFQQIIIYRDFEMDGQDISTAKGIIGHYDPSTDSIDITINGSWAGHYEKSSVMDN